MLRLANYSGYLDNWPGEAIDAVKNISSSVTTVFTEAFEEFSTSTRDVLLSASDSFAYVGDSFVSLDTMTETVYSMSESVMDIWNAQKYALLFGTLYFKLFENYFQEDGI